LSVILRQYGYRSGSKGGRKSEPAGEEDVDEDEVGEEEDDAPVDDLSEMSTIAFKEDSNLPSNYKELKVHLKSARLDAIVSAGLSISRKKVDDIFLDSKLRHNGDRVLKKSKQLKEGDYVDVLLPAEEGVTMVKRVRVVKIVNTEGSANNKLKVFIRSWRSPVSV
jgi:ribosomal 50S subunit-recycling heat shock protein